MVVQNALLALAATSMLPRTAMLLAAAVAALLAVGPDSVAALSWPLCEDGGQVWVS